MNKNTNLTGNRILHLLNLFLEKREISMDEIINSFADLDLSGEIHCKECIIKYINTLKEAGYIIIRKNKKYSLEQVPQTITKSQNMLDTLIKIDSLSKFIYTKEHNNKRFSIIEDIKILLSVSDKQKLNTLLEDNYGIKISKNEKNILEQCEKIYREEQRIKLIYLNDDTNITEITCEPYDIIYKNKQVYISVFDLHDFDKKLINLKFIKEIKQLPVKLKFKHQNKNAKLIFMDKLAKSYTLKENEKIVQKTKDFIIISTTYNDKNQFIKRILRYGELCKIISPISLKESFLSYLLEMVVN